MHADILITFAIHRQLGRNLDVGVLKIGQLLFPLAVLKFEEEGAQNFGIVKRFIAVRLYIRRRALLARLRRFLIASAAEAAAAEGAAASIAAFFSQVFS